MNILALSYTNIWPFADTTKTVTFLAWSTLVTAPIWSGKSFLFFDGPLFALYKYSSRPMLSRTCKKGAIRCVFYYESQWYLIERQLKPTKSWNDSVQSRLWTVDGDPTALFGSHEAIQEWDHLFGVLESRLEEVQFTSGRELDEAMKALLPPRELIQSVYLLMQESDHVFELPPAQRINVFKHLFGLIGIDEAKDKLTDRKKELTTMLKLLEDESDANQKFTTLVSWLRGRLAWLRDQIQPGGIDAQISTLFAQPTITDLLLVDQEMTIQGFTIEAGLMDTVRGLSTDLAILQKQWYTLDAEVNALQKQITELATQKSGAERQLMITDDQVKKAHRSYTQLDKRISEIQATSTQDYEVLSDLNHIDEIDTLSVGWLTHESTLEDIIVLIQETIQQGRDIAQQMQLLQQRQQSSDEKKQSLIDDIQKLDEQLTAVSVKYDEQMKFHCNKIEGPCPYVEAIKGSAVKSLKEQQGILDQQKAMKQQQLEKLWDVAQVQAAKTQHADLQAEKKQAGSLLGLLHWKIMTKRREHYQWLKVAYDKKLQELQTLQRQRQAIELPDPETLKWKREMLEQQAQQIETNKLEKVGRLQTQQTQYSEWNYGVISQWMEGLSVIDQTVGRIQELIDTYREKHQRIQDCKDELWRNKELVAIFSKELMVVALQDFLPNLEHVINTFLEEVVDYQIKFLTPESVSDSLELDIEIHDHHGVRQVKSLSGWQRATLKIAWILAVSSLFNGQFLFLDETITSLDNEAVARIGRLLENAMKARETKLLLVTHAQQIQQMEMWERVVSL